jgi:hypothetical protein
MVGGLIQQAGMIPASLDGKKVVYYDAALDIIRHHWRYLKSSKELRELILVLNSFHSKYTKFEAIGHKGYKRVMGSMKKDFEMGRCPDTWSPADQREYYGRLYDLIAEWNKRPSERDFEQDKFEWFKVKIDGIPYSLSELINVKKLIDGDFVDGIINPLKANIEAYLGRTFEFDTDVEGDRNAFISALMQP